MIRALTEAEVRTGFFGLMAEIEAGSWFDWDKRRHLQWLERRVSRRVGCGGQFYGTTCPDGEPLGLYCLVVEDHPTCGGYAEVLDLGVVETQRRQGHGTRLLRDAERRSVAAGVCRVRMLTYAGDAIAIAFYGKAGFTAVAEVPGLNGPEDRGQVLMQKELT